MRPLFFLLNLQLWLMMGGILFISEAAVKNTEDLLLIDCGASKETKVGDVTWRSDDEYIKVGNKSFLSGDLLPNLQTVRFFPDVSTTKYCYELPANNGTRYLVRTTYYYGAFDRKGSPPIFYQIIDGMRWGVVNTTEDYSRGLSTYYEKIISATRETLSVCLARNRWTVSSPFISALELKALDKSMYNTTDFSKYALLTVARHSFGRDGDIIRFPDDPFGRYWLTFTDKDHPNITSQTNASLSDFWNKPPLPAFQTALTTKKPNESLELQWPAVTLPSSSYYIALYFQDSSATQGNWRVFNISINGKNFYSGLNVTTSGVVVYSNSWRLSGLTQIKLTPAPGSTVGPLINAGEVLQIRELGERKN